VAGGLPILTPPDTADLPEDLLVSIESCVQGRFYETMMTEGERAKGKQFRDRLKVRFFFVLFGETDNGLVWGRNRVTGRFPNKTRERFRRHHPTLYRVLAQLKAKDYRHSSYLLQNYEATLMIYRVCGRIMREHPETLVWTRHDSIVTSADAVPYVRGVILGEFSRLGVVPALKTKFLTGGDAAEPRPHAERAVR
jgi:hypothetical protein